MVNLDLRQLVEVARRRWPIVILLMLMTGASAYVLSSRQEDQYAANVKLLVISGQPDSGSDFNSLQTSRSLAETYRQLVETKPVMNRVIDTLGLTESPQDLNSRLETSVVRDTQIVEVSVVASDPEQAALLANTVASEFRSYIMEQVDPRIGAQVEIVDPADAPGNPFDPRPARSLLLGLFVGVLLGAGVVALLEFLDNTVKPEVDIPTLAHAPVLATLPEITRLVPGGSQVYTMAQPRSSAAESMRLLRTNLEFAAASGQVASLTITSPSPDEGKSTITANLGVVLAQAGLTVAVIDADLRQPSQHRIFGVQNREGLSTLLTRPDQQWETVARKVALSGLILIPSGPVPPNPADLLNSDRFRHLLETIKQDVDVVLLDTPPMTMTSDSLIVSSGTDGVMLVCQSHKTRIEALRQAVRSIRQGNIRLVGVVLNRHPRQFTATYYGDYQAPVPVNMPVRSPVATQ